MVGNAKVESPEIKGETSTDVFPPSLQILVDRTDSIIVAVACLDGH